MYVRHFVGPSVRSLVRRSVGGSSVVSSVRRFVRWSVGPSVGRSSSMLGVATLTSRDHVFHHAGMDKIFGEGVRCGLEFAK